MAEDQRANKKLKPLSERVIRDIDGKLPEQKRNKVSLVTTAREQWVLRALALQ